jgi:ABC-2 type transport system ATP-binding protein
LSPECINEIRQVIERHQGELVSVEHPTTTLEELFLSIVRDSEARPGRRVVHGEAIGPPPSPN